MRETVAPDDPYPGYSAEEVLEAWEAVRARQQVPHPGRTIGAEPAGFWRAYRARWRAAPLHVAMTALVLGVVVLPFTFAFGVLLLLGIYATYFTH